MIRGARSPASAGTGAIPVGNRAIRVLLAGRLYRYHEVGPGGGVAKAVSDLAQALGRRTDVAVTFLGVDDRARRSLEDASRWARVGLVRFSYRNPIDYARLFTLLRSGRFDVVNAHGATVLTLLLCLLKQLFRLPLIYSAHGAVTDEISLGASYRPFKRSIERFILRQCDALTVVSQLLRTRLKWPDAPEGERAWVIHNGIDSGYFQPTGSQRFRSAYPLAGDFIVFVGNASYLKGIDVLLQAAERLPCPLVIIGPSSDFHGRLRARHRGLYERGRVLATGPLPDDLVASAYESSSVFVLPSRQDSFPMAALEAMAKGVPPVISEAVGIRELIRDGDNGYVVPVEDAERLADRVSILLRDRQLRLQMGERARATVAGLTWEVVAGRYAEVYAHVTAQP